MSCSISRIVRSPASALIIAAVDCVSPCDMPCVGSSSSSIFGRQASDTAISSRRCSPCDKCPASSVALSDRPNCASSSSARSRAAVLRPTGNSARPTGSSTCEASRRFSNTLRSKNRLVIWKERESPARNSLCVLQPVTSAPAKDTRPCCGRSAPDTRLNSVLLPAPFGPITEVMPPRAAEKDRSLTARSAPKLIDRPATSRMGVAPLMPAPCAARPSARGAAAHSLRAPWGRRSPTA